MTSRLGGHRNSAVCCIRSPGGQWRFPRHRRNGTRFRCSRLYRAAHRRGHLSHWFSLNRPGSRWEPLLICRDTRGRTGARRHVVHRVPCQQVDRLILSAVDGRSPVCLMHWLHTRRRGWFSLCACHRGLLRSKLGCDLMHGPLFSDRSMALSSLRRRLQFGGL